MSPYVLTCCSTADMSADFFKQRDIHYVCFHYLMDGNVFPDDLGATMPFKEFYARIADGATPTTSQVNVAEFTAFFEPFLAAGQDILHVSLSSGLSGAIGSAQIAREDLLAKYPDRQISIVDSLGASSGYGLLMDSLADRRDAGDSLDEATLWAENNKLNVHHWFFSTDLTSYLRGGRISKTSAVVGNLLGICPLLNMDVEGHLVPRQKVLGKTKTIKELVKKMAEHAQGGFDYAKKCFISCSDCFPDARKVADIIEAQFPKLNGKVIINSVGTVIGSHTGPGTVALFFFGDARM